MLFALAGLGRTSAQNKNFFFFFRRLSASSYFILAPSVRPGRG